jgi:two-component system sensor histidine kinase LytS
MARKHNGWQISAAVILFIIAVVAAGLLMWCLLEGRRNVPLILMGVAVLAFSVFGAFWYIAGPDRIKAKNTSRMLTLANQMLGAMEGEGLTANSAQRICELLLPNTRGVAVAITDRTTILGYVGVSEDGNPSGLPIRTLATKDTLEDGATRVMLSAQEIGFKDEVKAIQAAIISPLVMSNKVVGTLKFYYAHPHFINDTEKSIAEGFASILSTQIAAAAMEQQRKLATSMELRALQTQINPHFLFNTLNTIAAFIRMDPDKARVLLREFATFYRKTLENEGDLIELSKEVEQTQRYFTFELARFGEDMLELDVDIPEEAEDILIPAFMVQPIVENSVQHARPADRKLTVKVQAHLEGDDLYIVVSDNGVGMSEEVRRNIMHAKSDTGLGIAIRNIKERVTGYFGPDSSMDFESTLGKGTVVTLFLKDAASKERE